MNTREEHYEYGLSLGYAYADADLHEHAASGAVAEELRAEAREAWYYLDHSDEKSRSWIAFKLGIVRGYRDAVRTLRAGRWGT